MACDPDEEPHTDPSSEVPSCIDTSVLSESAQIKTQEVNGNDHYWIDTDANEADGDEYILSMECDTVCYYGGWVDPECIEDYDLDAWEVVWP